MAYITGLTRDRNEWTPQFVMAIDKGVCIGCGRCYKACAMDVLAYEEVDEDDSAKAYMTIGNEGNCVGCQACGRACPKKCFTFAPMEL